MLHFAPPRITAPAVRIAPLGDLHERGRLNAWIEAHLHSLLAPIWSRSRY